MGWTTYRSTENMKIDNFMTNGYVSLPDVCSSSVVVVTCSKPLAKLNSLHLLANRFWQTFGIYLPQLAHFVEHTAKQFCGKPVATTNNPAYVIVKLSL